MLPYFQYPWADYLLCEKYYLLSKKFFSTDWYSKTLKSFKSLLPNLKKIENFVSNLIPGQLVQISAESQYYLRDSYIFTIVEVCRYRLLQKIA